MVLSWPKSWWCFFMMVLPVALFWFSSYYLLLLLLAASKVTQKYPASLDCPKFSFDTNSSTKDTSYTLLHFIFQHLKKTSELNGVCGFIRCNLAHETHWKTEQSGFEYHARQLDTCLPHRHTVLDWYSPLLHSRAENTGPPRAVCSAPSAAYPSQVHVSFYNGATENILTGNITKWHG